MPAYWVNEIHTVHDPDKVAAYAELAGPAIESAGGRFLARGNPEHVFESGRFERTVVIEFTDVATAVAAYESSAYQQALAALGDGADRDIRIVPGV